MAFTTNMNEQKLFAIQGWKRPEGCHDTDDTLPTVWYTTATQNCSFTCLQFSNSSISMAEPTASNIIQSSLLKHKYIKTSFLWNTQPYQIQIILSLLKQVQPHKAAFAKLASVHDTQPTVSNTKVMHTHRRMCVCVQNIEKIQPVNCKCFLDSMIFESIKTDQIRKQNPANVPWDIFFQRSKYNWIILFWKTTWYDLKPESLWDPNDTLKARRCLTSVRHLFGAEDSICSVCENNHLAFSHLAMRYNHPAIRKNPPSQQYLGKQQGDNMKQWPGLGSGQVISQMPPLLASKKATTPQMWPRFLGPCPISRKN